MHGGGAGGRILNLGQGAWGRLCQEATWDWRCLGLEQSPWEPGERVILIWCVEGMWAAFLEETGEGQSLASFAHGWEGERYS